MKKKHYVSLAVLLSVIVAAFLLLRSDYYYSYGKKIYIKHRKDLTAYKIPLSNISSESTQGLFSTAIKEFQVKDKNFDFANQNILVLKKNRDSEFRNLIGSEFLPFKKYGVAKNRLADVGMLIDDGILLRFIEGTSEEEMKSVLQKYGPSKPSKYIKERYVLETNSKFNRFEVSNELYNNPLIEYAHPNFLFRTIEHSSCGDCIEISDLQPSMGNNNHHKILGTLSLYNQNVRGKSSVKIAVIDDAIKVDHQYFQERAPGPHYSTENSDDDPNPINPADCHGTPVAGLALGNTPDASFFGTCPDCTLVAVQSLGSSRQLIEIVEELIFGQKVSVINMSWEHHCYVDGAIRALSEDVKDGRDGKGVAVCMSVGNSPVNICNDEHLQNKEYLFSIAATDRDDRVYSFGKGDCLDFAAPGYGIRSAGYSQGMSEDVLCNISSTSAAAPLVSGIIGLMIGQNANISIDGIEQILKNTADKVALNRLDSDLTYDDQGHNIHVGYGRVNGKKALTPSALISFEGSINQNDAKPFKLNVNCIYGIEKITINGAGFQGVSPIVFDADTYSYNVESGSLLYSSPGLKQLKIVIVDGNGNDHIFNEALTVQ